MLPAHYFQSVLVDNPAAASADIEIFPSFARFDFVALLVARIEAIGVRPVSTHANPCFFVAFLVFNSLLSVLHFCHYSSLTLFALVGKRGIFLVDQGL